MFGSAQRLHVAVGVIYNARGDILIAKRAKEMHQGGVWEFPGGKLEAGESVTEALYRELLEELDISIDIDSCTPLVQIRHDYTDRQVLLDVWCVRAFAGDPRGMQGQPLRWVTPVELRNYAFPQANHPILTTLLLPRRMLVTGDWGDRADFSRRLGSALAKGVRLVQLRAHQCTDEEYRELFALAKHPCDACGALLIANRTPEMAIGLGSAGLHLSAERLMSLSQRPVNTNIWLGASCHNLAEIHQAERINADYITLGPVLPTQSHPDSIPLGIDRFTELVKSTSVPVFGLGGLSESDEMRLRAAGAHGFAAIRSGW